MTDQPMTTQEAVESALEDIEIAAIYQPDGDYTMPFAVELAEAARVLRTAIAEKDAEIARLRAALAKVPDLWDAVREADLSNDPEQDIRAVALYKEIRAALEGKDER